MDTVTPLTYNIGTLVAKSPDFWSNSEFARSVDMEDFHRDLRATFKIMAENSTPQNVCPQRVMTNGSFDFGAMKKQVCS